MLRKFMNTIVASALVASLSFASSAQAQRIVYDPTNYAQNLLSATRAMEQIRNQIRQIEQASAMLRQNPLQLSAELSQSIQEARSLLQSAEGIAFEAKELGQDLRALYPDTWEDFDLGRMLGQSDHWMRESRESLQRAMAAEARAVAAVERARDQTGRALQSSVGAEGQTGAIQATNQLLGVQTAQLAEIQMLLIAQGRAIETERMERIAREERARELQRRAFPSQHQEAVAPARSAF